MPQTTDTYALACGLLEIATDAGCVGWTDISGSSQVVEAPEQTRISGEAYTLDGDNALVEGGKKEPLEIAVEIVYTETAGEAFEIVRAAWEAGGCGKRMCLRYSPGGGDIGDAMYTTPRGIITRFVYPNMDASAGGPIMAGFTLKVGYITRSVIAT
jgi:hypothetical protein